jgi:hypothetical protein
VELVVRSNLAPPGDWNCDSNLAVPVCNWPHLFLHSLPETRVGCQHQPTSQPANQQPSNQLRLSTEFAGAADSYHVYCTVHTSLTVARFLRYVRSTMASRRDLPSIEPIDWRYRGEGKRGEKPGLHRMDTRLPTGNWRRRRSFPSGRGSLSITCPAEQRTTRLHR